MRKFILLVLTILLGFCSWSNEIQIVIPNQPGKLVFPPDGDYTYPALFLQKYIKITTGKHLPVVKESQADNKNRNIYIGATKFAKKYIAELTAFKPEELAIIPVGKDLIICGEVSDEQVDRGTLFGVYEFLERELNVRWFFPHERCWNELGNGIIAPAGQTLKFPDKLVRSAPAFRKREGGISYRYRPLKMQKEWHPVLRFGVTLPHDNANHTQNEWYNLYSKKHPEYFAKDSSGKPRLNHRHKHRNYICLSSEAVFKQMMKNLDDHAAGKDVGAAWSIRPPTENCVFFCCNDGMTPETTCQCSECKAMLEMRRNYEGRGSELFFRFINKYATAVQKKFPQKRFATLAYSHYLAPPVKSAIPDNVDIAYVGPKIHYAADPAVYNMHMKYIKQWSEILGKNPQRMSIWMNIVNPSVYTSAVPFAYPNLLKKFLNDVRYTVSGFFINGLNPYLVRHGANGLYGSIQTLPMVYIQSRLLWNPEADVLLLLKDYCQKMFGPSWQEMFQFYSKVIERWENFYQTNFMISELDFIHQVRYPLSEIAVLKKLLNEAEKKSEKAPESLRKIRYFKKRIYSRFFAESEKYHRLAGYTPSYDALQLSEPPEIDGKGVEKFWSNLPVMHLKRFQWGDISPRMTKIRMGFDRNNLYILAEMNKSDKKVDELRVQLPIKAEGLRNKFSPNIQRNWRVFSELRISYNGALKTIGNFPKSNFKTGETSVSWIIEGAIPLKNIIQGTSLKHIRLQFLRYTDMWNDYDLWAPTLGGITDYPTWKFGLINLLSSGEKTNDGLE